MPLYPDAAEIHRVGLHYTASIDAIKDRRGHLRSHRNVTAHVLANCPGAWGATPCQRPDDGNWWPCPTCIPTRMLTANGRKRRAKQGSQAEGSELPPLPLPTRYWGRGRAVYDDTPEQGTLL